jgi:hypothetical protein
MINGTVSDIKTKLTETKPISKYFAIANTPTAKKTIEKTTTRQIFHSGSSSRRQKTVTQKPC